MNKLYNHKVKLPKNCKCYSILLPNGAFMDKKCRKHKKMHKNNLNNENN